MRYVYRSASHFLLLVIILTSTMTATPTIPQAVKEHIEERYTSGSIKGIAVALIDSTGVSYYTIGNLSGDSETAIDETTVFEIGSFTKVFTAVLLMEMVEKGEISLDDPVSNYLPDSIRMETEDGHKVLIRHLVTHHSTLPRLPGNFAPTDMFNPYADYTVEMMYAFLAGFTPDAEGLGKSYEYSNLGSGLLGHILAQQTGTNYEKAVIERLCRPLGMDETMINLTPELTERLAQGYAPNGHPVLNWDIPTLAGAGAFRSTVTDMATFIAGAMGHHNSPLLPILQKSYSIKHDIGHPALGIAYGWHTLDGKEGERIIWHNGGTGGYHSFCGFTADRNVGVVVLTNINADIDIIGLHLLNSDIPLMTPEQPDDSADE